MHVTRYGQRRQVYCTSVDLHRMLHVCSMLQEVIRDCILIIVDGQRQGILKNMDGGGRNATGDGQRETTDVLLKWLETGDMLQGTGDLLQETDRNYCYHTHFTTQCFHDCVYRQYYVC